MTNSPKKHRKFEVTAIGQYLACWPDVYEVPRGKDEVFDVVLPDHLGDYKIVGIDFKQNPRGAAKAQPAGELKWTIEDNNKREVEQGQPYEKVKFSVLLQHRDCKHVMRSADPIIVND